MSLPKGYKRLEYIQSSGTQYVDSEFVPNENTRCVTVFASTYIPEGLVENLPIYGSAKSYDSNAYEFWLTGKGWCCFGSQAYKNDFGLVANTQYVSDQNKNILTVAGNTYTFNVSTFTAPHSLLLLASYRTNGGVIAGDPKAKVNLYSCQIYDNGTLVRDYIPCQNASGGVGLWDEVEGKFYANAGTGEFIAGPEVQTVPKAPANFRVESESDALVTLAWDASDKALGYLLYRQGHLLADTEETSVSVVVEPFSGAVFTLTAYNENGEGAGTSLTHFSIPENPLLYLITDRTQQDVTEGNPKGYYAASDLNRVGFAVEYLAGRLKDSGVSVAVSPVLTWTDADWATPTTMKGYLADVQTMRDALKLASTTPEVPEDMERLTYTEANEIEAILLALDTHIKQMLMTVDAGWAMGLAYTGFYAKEAY